MHTINALQQVIPTSPSLLLFSGGLDSCAVLGAAISAGRDMVPVYVNNGFNRATIDEVSQQARNLGAPNMEVLPVTPSPKVCENPADRCFYCKSQFLKELSGKGRILLDGTTTSDTNAYRPGLQALKNYSVISPLAQAGLSKQDSEQIARHLGANAELAGMESCLATRLKYEEKMAPGILEALRETERYIISKTGDYDVRCRYDGPEHIRIEVKKPETYQLFAQAGFRNHIRKLTDKVSLFTTMDLQASRPNAYDNYLKTKQR